MVADVTANLELLDLQEAIKPIVNFIDLLNNWYIRRSRRRFWRSENDQDKTQAYETLYSVLMTVVKSAAPIIPFVTEEIYLNLKTDDMPASVHLCDYPEADNSRRDNELEFKMEMTRKAVSMGRALRAMHSLKTRQPLKAMHIVTIDQDAKKVLREMSDIIREELNVKEVFFRENEQELVEYSAKANFKVLGKLLGPKMKAAAAKIEQLEVSAIQSLLDGSTLNIDVDGEALELTIDHVMVQRFEKENLKVLNEGLLTIALDPEITEELRQEGMVRDLIRSVQNLRKEKNLDVSDRIILYVDGDNEVIESVKKFSEHISNETLSTQTVIERLDSSVKTEMNDKECWIDLIKS